MNKVCDHVEALPINFLFARMMEVKLHQLVPVRSDGEAAAPPNVDLYAVPIVSDVERRRRIFELEGRRCAGIDSFQADIDGRLGFPGSAQSVFGIELGPVRRALGTAV